MKRLCLSALIGAGVVALIFPLFSGSSAAWGPESYPLVCGGAETFKTDSPAPTPTPPGGIIYVPLPGRPVPPDKIDIVKVDVALASNGGVASASSELDATRTAGAAINGDRWGLHWGSDPSTGSGWCDATKGVYPDWLRVDFKGKKTIDEIDVFTVQDDIAAPVEISKPEALRFTKYGITDLDVQYWDGSDWAKLPAPVRGSTWVWKQFKFPAVKTSAIRILVKNALNDYSRIVELEAWGN
jgi:hypothetical protein